MFKKILLGFAIIVLGFVVLAAVQPADFEIARRVTIAAPQEAVFTQVNDFHQWKAWSPWENLDPNAKNTFEGPSAGTGAVYRWSGNNNIGEGSMTITNSVPHSLVRIKLDFVRPFQDTSTVEFTFQPAGNDTLVIQSMYGKRNFMGKAIGLFMNCDKMIGGMYEQGLAKLKSVVEGK